jgi:serralysin
MSAATDPIVINRDPNTWINGIEWGTRWYTPSSPGQTIITYAPASQAGRAPTALEQAAYLQIFTDISRVCNITFVAGTTANADIVMASVTAAVMGQVSGDSTNLGLAEPPRENYNNAIADWQSTVYVNRDAYSGGASPNALYKGGFDYVTWLHEIGHALGLAHPHDTGGGSTIFPGVTASFDSYGLGNLNQGIYTTMSYNDGWDQYYGGYLPSQYGYQATMMAFDVAALQNLYGANYTTALGNDYYVLGDTATYGAGYQCIWDAGGSDAIYYGGNYAVQIDLRAATLDPSGSYGAGGFVSFVPGVGISYSGFTIANGVTIENAFAGNGADYVFGNDVANIIYGYGGNDRLYGLGGNDYIWGGTGDDVILGGLGADTIIGFTGNDYLLGESGADAFYLNTDIAVTGFDYAADFALGTDYFLLPAAYQGAVYFAAYGGAAYGYIAVGGGYYTFGAPGLTVAQIAAAVYYI